MCADFKGTINLALIQKQYPLPLIKDLCVIFMEQKFPTLDLTKTYHYMNVNPEHGKSL